jgi:hypothetical protein
MRRKTPSVADQHQDWLGQVDTDGPFLALPVLKDIWPQGVERLGDADDRMITFKQAYPSGSVPSTPTPTWSRPTL